ncbi:type IV secretion system DNA-binding domain-containing protein [Sphingomonas silueang]|uniref:type IV secretion system DNA-binding domain-containing protein n=1 Tax=Sphingomonas silueang TaxID=3156617 RepID=UPI0032B5FA85
MPGDIRSDGRALPLRHRSSRGQTPRNSGNFTRGSQLFSHEMLMWFSGIKMPFILWGLIFFLAYTVILSLTLDENNVQLICMRVLAWLWEWIGFDQTKAVDLLMSDGSHQRTIMGVVPHVGEVIRAWNKAVHGLIGSLLFATFATVPLAIWFVDYSQRRGRDILAERHERGAALVEHAVLRAELGAYNRAQFLKEARDRHGLTEKQVETFTQKALAAAGLHYPYTLAGLPYPYRTEQAHTMLIGTTGSGKTTVLRDLISQMRTRGDHAVIFDLTGSYVEAFYDPSRDTILNPLDTRCPAWSIFGDCDTESEFTAAAAALIPSDGGASDPFWVMAARTLFIEMCLKLIERGEATTRALAETLMMADLSDVHTYLQHTIADPLTAPEAARMAESIRAVFNTNAKALRALPEEGNAFSIRAWITQEKTPGALLFISSNYVDLEMNKSLLTLWSNLAIHSLMTMKHSRSLRTWFMFDEIGALHRLPAIEQGLQTARNFGGAMILGLHSFDKLVQVYGPENARNLSSLARTKLILAAADLDTAEQCARYIGNREVREMDEAYSYGHNSTRDASTITPRTQVEPLVLPDDIVNLPSMHGFVKFAEGFPAADIKLQWRAYPTVAEGFLRVPKTRKKEEGRGEEGTSETTGGAGGRDGTPELVKDDVAEAMVEREIPALPAPASIQALTGTPSEQQDQQAAERLDPFAPRSATVEKPASDDKSEDERAPDSGNRQAESTPQKGDTRPPAPPPVEDQATIDERHGLGAGRGDEDMVMGD